MVFSNLGLSRDEAYDELRAVWLSLLVVLLYTAAVPAWGYPATKEAVDAAILFVAVILAWSWAPAAYRAFRSGGQGGAAIVISLWMAWATLVVQRLWVIAVRWNGRPDWMVNSPNMAMWA